MELDPRFKRYQDKYILVTQLIDRLRADIVADTAPWENNHVRYKESYIDDNGDTIQADLNINFSEIAGNAIWYFWVNNQYSGGVEKYRKPPKNLTSIEEQRLWTLEQAYGSLHKARERALSKLEPVC